MCLCDVFQALINSLVCSLLIRDLKLIVLARPEVTLLCSLGLVLIQIVTDAVLAEKLYGATAKIQKTKKAGKVVC